MTPIPRLMARLLPWILALLGMLRNEAAAPVLAPMADVAFDENTASPAILVRAEDPDTPPPRLQFAATVISNGALFPDGAQLQGVGRERTLTLIPAPNRNGEARVRVQVVDETGGHDQTEFAVVVRPVNTAPTLQLLSGNNFETTAGSGVRFNVRVADADDPVEGLVLAVTADDARLVASATSAGQSFGREVSATAAYEVGATQLRLRVTDPGGAFTEESVALRVLLPEQVDFGDAPDFYPVRLVRHGAWHVSSAGFRLGTRVDNETDGLPRADAEGDDATVTDDEDGVVWPSPLRGGETNLIRVTASAAGKLDAWIDFDRDGHWDDTTERIGRAISLGPALNATLPLVIPSNTAAGLTFARVRFSATGNLPPDGGAGLGEVEDYRLTLDPVRALLDFGDAPAPFPTSLAADGARHSPSPLRLGVLRDIEEDGFPEAGGLGDDQQGASDEDGVGVVYPLVPGQTALLKITASAAARFDAWIDFNGDQDWSDPGEQIATSAALVAGGNTWSVAVPPAARPGTVLARFRLSTAGGLGFTGLATDGEVEDYALTIEPPPAPCTPSLGASPRRPNIIVILADDLGYCDLGIQGSRDIPTPRIDALARSGLRFTSGYVTAPVCSPSRAGLMTGRYQQRFGHETNPGTSLERHPIFGLPRSESTLGDRFKALVPAYATAWIGKSHLGGVPEFHPQQRGFDEYFGFIESHHDYFDDGVPLGAQHDPILRGTVPIVETNYLTTAFARECVDYIDRHAHEPFVLYAPFNAIHFPLQATPQLLDRAAGLAIANPARRSLAPVLLGLDDAVGAIVDRLQALNLETNTLIFFTSDNGGTTQLGSVNQPLRGGKTEVYEGGIRVPFFISWPGQLPTNQVVHFPVSTLDILPTAMVASGRPIPEGWHLDGVNLLPYLCGATPDLPHARLFWRIETDGLSPGGDVLDGIRAMREGDWKLVKPGIQRNWELYNLATDLGETTDLASARPEVVQQLVRTYEEWASELERPRWAVDDPHFETPAFVLEDLRIGTVGVSYHAPQFSPSSNHVAFVDAEGTLWRGELDALTGFLRSVHGQDLRVDTSLPIPDPTTGAPRWGLSLDGPSLVYSKPDAQSRLQLWRARTLDSAPTLTPLTTDPADEHFGPVPREDVGQAAPALAFSSGSRDQPVTGWAEAAGAAQPTSLPSQDNRVQGVQWIPGTADLLYATTPTGSPVAYAQLGRYSTASGTLQLLTEDVGNKSNPRSFVAPEWNGELGYAALVDRTSVALYRDLGDHANGRLTRVATLAPPADGPSRHLSALEPVEGLRGYNGTSLFTCVARTGAGDEEIWLFGLGPDENHHLVRRVDEGLGSASVGERRLPRLVAGERELYLYYLREAGANPVHLHVARSGVRSPDYRGTPSGFTRMEFRSSLFAGGQDPQGTHLGGTETLHLVPHLGRLYASQGSRGNFPYPDTLDPLGLIQRWPTWSGGQVLYKDSASSPWRVDEAAPPIFRAHLRVEALAEVTLITHSDGRLREDPAPMLIAGLSDFADRGERLASVRTRMEGPSPTWEESHVATTSEPANTLSFGTHLDRATGVHHLFAGLSNGEIYRGGFNLLANGHLEWASQDPELGGAGPVLRFAEANGFLYAATALRQTATSAPLLGGLYVRRDTQRQWVLVHQWPSPTNVVTAPEAVRVAQGLTAVPEPHGGGRQVLLVGVSWSGTIELIDPKPDPDQGHVVTVELDVRDFLARRWRDETIRHATIRFADDGFAPARDPVTGETVHLLGLGIEAPATSVLPAHGAYFLIRHSDGTYEAPALDTFLAPLSPGRTLRGVRAIAFAPFADETHAGLYFGGYDTGDAEAHHTGWILEGSWIAWPEVRLSASPTGEWQVDWEGTDDRWALEVASDLRADPPVWERVPGKPSNTRGLRSQLAGDRGSRAFFRLRGP